MKNISDEHIVGNGFTGSMLGVFCTDAQGMVCMLVSIILIINSIVK